MLGECLGEEEVRLAPGRYPEVEVPAGRDVPVLGGPDQCQPGRLVAEDLREKPGTTPEVEFADWQARQSLSSSTSLVS